MTTTATRERPILMSGPMVRAILDGRKTQTRRVVKPQPPHSCVYKINGAGTHALCLGPGGECVPPTGRSVDHRLPCPYGAPGDVLWVRESFCQSMTDGCWDWQPDGSAKYLYAATDPDVVACDEDGFHRFCKDGSAASPWKPSIHMPCWACRLWLRVKAVRVERVQEISPHDALAEGADYQHADECPPDFRAVEWFRELWDSINADRGFGWAVNPWVWVVEFERIEKPEGWGASERTLESRR